MRADISNLLMEMRQIKSEALNVNPAQSAPAQSVKPTNEFGQVFSKALSNVNELQLDAAAKRTAVETGSKEVSLVEAMVAAQKSSIAFEATVQVRNKMVEAYKEVMSMSI